MAMVSRVSGHHGQKEKKKTHNDELSYQVCGIEASLTRLYTVYTQR